MYEIGLEKDEIDTPALLIQLDLMEKNIATMANFFESVEADLRAHTKVHRTPVIAHKQIKQAQREYAARRWEKLR